MNKRIVQYNMCLTLWALIFKNMAVQKLHVLNMTMYLQKTSHIQTFIFRTAYPNNLVACMMSKTNSG